jgi:hypothetical protein
MSKTKKRAYISGPIRGIENYRDAFDKAEEYYKAQGYKVISPAKKAIEHGIGGTDERQNDPVFRKKVLGQDIKDLLSCDTIIMLPNWEKSLGAIAELHIANACFMEVICHDS